MSETTTTHRDPAGDLPQRTVSGVSIRLEGVTKRYPGQRTPAVDSTTVRPR